MFVASDEATSGSVIRYAERIFPASRGSSHNFFISSVPYLSNTSMFPVSGAEQLKTSAARWVLPISSARYAYSTVDSPSPFLESVNQKFHSPFCFAFVLSPSSISTWRLVNCHLFSLLISVRYSCSLGSISVSIISMTLSRNFFVFSVIPRSIGIACCIECDFLFILPPVISFTVMRDIVNSG